MKVWITKDINDDYQMWQYEDMPYRTIHGYWQTYGADNFIRLDKDDVKELLKFTEKGFIPNDEAVEYNICLFK